VCVCVCVCVDPRVYEIEHMHVEVELLCILTFLNSLMLHWLHAVSEGSATAESINKHQGYE